MSRPQQGSLIGSIVERKPGPPISTPTSDGGTVKTGFPAVQHRSKSAFARARDRQKQPGDSSRSQNVPTITTKGLNVTNLERDGDVNDTAGNWRRQVEEENQRRVESMTEDEREEQRREILARFGPGIGDILKKARAARDAQAQATEQPKSPVHRSSTPLKSAMASRPSSPPPPLSTSTSRPPSRTDRHLRFADVKPQDVHVYESAPPSPKRKPLALMSPTEGTGPTISLGEWKGKAKEKLLQGEVLPPPFALEGPKPSAILPKQGDDDVSAQHSDGLPLEEGTPEYIRRRFFPTAAPHDPSLAWIEGVGQEKAKVVDSSLRFDLSGNIIPLSVSSTLPTHLGLHHHAEGEHAGYTLDDIFLLSRSTVPAQRSPMMGVLSGVARKLARGLKNPEQCIRELSGQEESLRKRIVAAGVEAMNERGSLGARAVEAMWVCIVYWDEEITNVEGVELKSSSDDVISSLPIDYILSHISDAFKTGSLPQESLIQLLAVIHRIAQESSDFADKIVATSNMVLNLIQRFLLTPIPPSDHSALPEPLALQVLVTLISASRTNASALVEPSEALLRFVVTLPSSSPFPPALSTSLLSLTLRVYTSLASYGLGAQLSTTATEHLNKLSQYVLSEDCTSFALRGSWLNLIHAWLICARDPHRTTPSHDILWSQVVGWGWGEEILELRPRLSAENVETWAALWAAEAAWLEGTSVNGVRGGQEEKLAAREALRLGFESGVEKVVVESAVDRLKAFLDDVPLECVSDPKVWSVPGKLARALASALRLWLSCIPLQSSMPLGGPPFELPLHQISTLCAGLATHSLWSCIFTSQKPCLVQAFLRPFSLLLSQYLGVSRMIPGVSEELWVAQAFAIVTRLLPGDEEMAVRAIEGAVSPIRPEFMESRGWPVPPVIWERNAMAPILPFLTYSLRHREVYIGPLWMSPASIAGATTQRLPFTDAEKVRNEGLPLGKDWIYAPLDHLLRSGQSGVFKSLPADWDYSETEIVRATLLLAQISREVLMRHGLHMFTLSREETVFACMKVFMLEHGQQEATSVEEVFRDVVVGQFIDWLLAPFTVSASTGEKPAEDVATLEQVAKRFLGASTPFYQYYTDFVALYDAISFSHPTFARLLLPPLSMRYPTDYRKFLWADHGHVIRTIKTPIEAVVTGGVEEFLWPVETNAEILSAYLRALVNGHASGFLRLIAVHHIACNIWPDLGVVSAGEKSTKLLQAVVNQGNFDTVRDVVVYHQTRDEVVLPPACLEIDARLKDLRRGVVEDYGGLVQERLVGLLK